MTDKSKASLFLLVALTSLSLSSMANASNTGSLTIEVDGLKSQEGNVCLSLFSSSQGFPSDPYKAVKVSCSPVSATPLTITFEDLQFGNYAIALFHDENGDGQLNTNVVGLPQEGFGFSNNPPLRPGPAQFSESMFVLAGQNTNVQIGMRYLR